MAMGMLAVCLHVHPLHAVTARRVLWIPLEWIYSFY